MTSISAERSGLAKVGMTLRRREQWGARRSYTDARSVSEPATKQFVHITVTNPGNYNSFDAHARAIEAIGISRFSNTGVSYNRLFMAGTRNVYEAQPIGRRGAHTVNDFRRSTCTTSGCPSRGTSLTAPSWNLNVNARAYAYASNVGFSVPDHVIDDMARTMAADRLAGFVTRNATIHGHRCVSAKSCPGDRVWERMHDLEKRVNHYVSNGLNGDSMSWKERIGWGGGWMTRVFPDTIKGTPDGYQAGSLLRLAYGYGRRIWSNGPERWWKYRGLDYVNDNPSTKDHQLARAHEYSFEALKLERRNAEKLDTLIELQGGADGQAIREHIDARADAIEAQITADAQRREEIAQQAQAERGAILDLVEQVGSGDLSADEFVDAVARRLSGADTDA